MLAPAGEPRRHARAGLDAQLGVGSPEERRAQAGRMMAAELYKEAAEVLEVCRS